MKMRNKSKKGNVFFFLPLVLMFLFLPVLSCEKQAEAPEPETEPVEEAVAEAVEEEELDPVELPEYTQALITFISGEADIVHQGESYYAEIGEFLEQEDTLIVYEGSYVELQFGETAVCRVQENTEIAMEKIQFAPGETDVKMGMEVGSVLTKVQKLAGNEKFKVKTETAVCGVRGTEFGVTVDQQKKTKLAVQEGEVSIMPGNADVDELKDRAEEAGENEILESIEKIEKSAPVVKANQEIEVEETSLQDTAASVKKVEEVVNKVAPAKPKPEKTAEGEAAEEAVEPERPRITESERRRLLDELNSAVEEANTSVQTAIAPPKNMSAESSKELKNIENMRLLAIATPAKPKVAEGEEKTAAEEEAAAPEEPQPILSKISLETNPRDAAITFNGVSVGRGRFSGIFEEGETLDFSISKEGYKTRELNITVPAAANGKRYRVRLERVPEPEPETKQVSINVRPRDAEVFINGESQGTGNYNGEYEVGTNLDVRVSREGYQEEELQIDVESAAPISYRVNLEEIVYREDVEVSVTPSDAEILLNNEVVGRGSFSGTYQAGTNLSFTARRENYLPQEFELEVTRDGNNSRDITLEEAVYEEPVRISTVPNNAEILINGRVVGRGSYSDVFKAGQQLNITVRSYGFRQKSQTLRVRRGGNNTTTVRLERLPVERRFQTASSNTMVGLAAGSGDRLISVSENGVLSAYQSTGQEYWSVRTGNTSNENSKPVVMGSTVAFSGAKELVLVDAAGGQIKARRNLDGASSHLFGRHLVDYDGNTALLPTNESIEVISLSNGNTIKTISIPGGSRMTPAVSGGNIAVANQQGEFMLMDYDSGNTIFRLDTDAVQPVALAPLITGGKAIFAGRKGTVVCVDLNSERVLWQRPLSDSGSASVFEDLVAGGKGVYIYADGTIYGLNLENGRNLFTPINGATSPPLYRNGDIYYGSGGRYLTAADASTGSIRKNLTVRAEITTRPVFSQQRFIVGSDDGEMLVIPPESLR
ncbi:MAG: PQQ-binding-like beta-propeller repeat protein [Spirochaetales bacterium]|nr:PQQ-binding-like beta-propeller repeat protein [Spirochaetales bacterium]MCF7937378.1 PQQ-binding-like beta-propeller repeat protein [Spirochaetales bacterium]